jgi:hypothetical protein
VPYAYRERSAQRFQQALGDILLNLRTFLDHFIEHGASAVGIAHVDIGTRQIEFGIDRIIVEIIQAIMSPAAGVRAVPVSRNRLLELPA